MSDDKKWDDLIEMHRRHAALGKKTQGAGEALLDREDIPENAQVATLLINTGITIETEAMENIPAEEER